ncbi:MAG: TatD family hydrolase [Candidatus Paceibacterota bacterium]|jgi:TatD DNase family protein
MMISKDIKIFDAHAHMQFSAYDSDRDDVLKRNLDSGVGFICVGTQADTSQAAIDLAKKSPNKIFATVGLHPVHTDKSFHDVAELGGTGHEFTSRGEIFDYDYYKKIAADPSVVGIGECGLDYYHLDEGARLKQRVAFEAQINLANEIKKPLMFHIREAYEDAYEIIKSLAKVKGDVHCYVGNLDTAKKFLDLGFYISFTGVITFPYKPQSGRVNYAEVVKYVPLDMMLSETDSPYLAPVPFRGKRCEPAYVEKVIEKIAEIKGLPFETVAEATRKNAEKLFSL